MKVLNTLVFAEEATQFEKFEAIMAPKPQLKVTYLTDIEATIERINAKLDDMLVLDTKMSVAILKKMNKIVDLIAPEMATIELHMNDEDFIQIKMNQMIQKWEEATNNSSSHKFWDNPNL